jgi:hypothetical protein
MFSALSEALQTILRTLDLFEVEHSLLMKRKLRYSSFLSGPDALAFQVINNLHYRIVSCSDMHKELSQ